MIEIAPGKTAPLVPTKTLNANDNQVRDHGLRLAA